MSTYEPSKWYQGRGRELAPKTIESKRSASPTLFVESYNLESLFNVNQDRQASMQSDPLGVPSLPNKTNDSDSKCRYFDQPCHQGQHSPSRK
jgi:hypothetical protein